MFFSKKTICKVKDYNLFYELLHLMTLRYCATYIKEVLEWKLYVKFRYCMYNFLRFF